MLQCLIMHINIMEAVDNTADTPINADKEDEVLNTEEIDEANVVAVSTVI